MSNWSQIIELVNASKPSKNVLSVYESKWYENELNAELLDSNSKELEAISLRSNKNEKPIKPLKKLASNDNELIDKLMDTASIVYKNELSLWAIRNRSNSGSSVNIPKESLILQMASGSGTFHDKMKALVLLVKSNPVLEINNLRTLIKMCSMDKRRESISVIDILKDLFTEYLLPNRKLIKFKDFVIFYQDNHSLLQNPTKENLEQIKKLLILMIFEHQLIAIYEQFLSSLLNYLKDDLPKVRIKAIGIVYDLLVSRPQSEQRLLKEFVSKICDKDPKTYSHCVHLLLKLMNDGFTNIAPNVVDHIHKLILSGSLTSRSNYIAVTVLNQIKFNKNTSSQVMIEKIIYFYFSMFKNYVHQENIETTSKILYSILIGINRTLPFLNNKERLNELVIDDLFKLCSNNLSVKSANNKKSNNMGKKVKKQAKKNSDPKSEKLYPFNVQIQVMVLLYQLLDFKLFAEDRFYQLIYSKLLTLASNQSNSSIMVFINLIFKMLERDQNQNRIKAIIKRLLQISLHCEPHFTGVLLMLISHLFAKNKKLYESLAGSNEQTVVSDRQTADKSSIFDFYKNSNTDPKSAVIENVEFTEFEFLKKFYFDSIASFSDQILKRQEISYNGDPLTDFTLLKYFEKFINKNPKKNVNIQPSSVFKSRQKNLVGSNIPVDGGKDLDLLSPEELSIQYYNKIMCENNPIPSRKRSQDSTINSDDDDNSAYTDEEEQVDWTTGFNQRLSKNNESYSSDDDLEESDQDDSDMVESDSE